MPKAPFVDFRAIKSQVSIQQILDRYGFMETLHGSGDSRRGPCPLHGGSSKNQFSVNLVKNIWNCFSDCKSGGNILDFVAKCENVDIHRAAVLICDWFNLKVTTRGNEPQSTPPKPKQPTQPPAKPLQKPTSDSEPNKPLGFELKDLQRQHPYLTARGITEEIADEFGLGFFSGAKGLMVGRIVIPIHNADGKLVAYAGRFPGEPPDNETPKYKFPPGFKKGMELYNIHRVRQESVEQPFIIVEGFFGCIHLWRYGARRVVAIMGSRMTTEQEAAILRCASNATRVVIALDENESGRSGAVDIASRLARQRFVRIESLGAEDRQPSDLTPEEIALLLQQ